MFMLGVMVLDGVQIGNSASTIMCTPDGAIEAMNAGVDVGVSGFV